MVSSRDYVQGIIREHRARPGDATNLFGQLVATDDAGTYLDDEDLTAIFITMMTSGNTNDLISNSIVSLERNPEQRDLLRRQPELTRNAIDEFLRYNPSVYNVHRATTRDAELGGFRIHEGSRPAAARVGQPRRRAVRGTGGARRHPEERTPAHRSGLRHPYLPLASGLPARKPR